jgi:hypothetical protein
MDFFLSTVSAEGDSFLSRQFASRASAGQIVFDLAFGMALPLICLWFDPVVFRTPTAGVGGFLGRYAVFAIVAIGFAMISLAFSMLIGRPAALFAGLLSAFTLIAALLGVVLLPITCIGVFSSPIAVLGMSPFATAFVFWRNTVRAHRKALLRGREPQVSVYSALGFLVGFVVPLAAQQYVTGELSRATEMALSTDPMEAAAGIKELKLFLPVYDCDKIVSAYDTEEDAGRRKRFAVVYRELTGDEIEQRLERLRD